MRATRHKEITIDNLRIKCRNQHRNLASLNKEKSAVKGMDVKHAIHCQIIAAELRLKGTQKEIEDAEKEIKKLNREFKSKPYQKGK
jgi:hypothetical protein